MDTYAIPHTRTTEHSITVAAPAEAVYELIADATRWPEIFTPTIHVERTAGEGQEWLRIWAVANGQPKTWTSVRYLDPQRLAITFRQEVSSPPVLSMGGKWEIQAQGDGSTLVRLLHDFTAEGDDPAHVRWITQATDTNSRAELARLRAAAGLGDELSSLRVSFEDSVEIAGRVEDTYEFIYRAQEWPARLPHVARLELEENSPNLQVMEMDTSTSDGSVHTTKSYRVCFPNERIVYKQVTLPKLMAAHTGCWSFTPTPIGLRITSRHTVIIEPTAVQLVLGEEATTAQARDFVQTALTRNSRITMEHAKAYAEARRDG